MVRLHPVPGYSVNPDLAPRVSPPPHDSLTPAERRRVMEAEPYSFLNVLRSSYDYPVETRPPAEEVRRHAALHLQRLIDEGVFLPTPEPSYYLYALETPGHRQIGVIAEISVGTIEEVVKPHERIRPERADDLAIFLSDVGVSSGPVCVTYQPLTVIDQFVEQAAGELEPILHFATDDGLTQTVWRLPDAQARTLEESFDGVKFLYLVDGHHRAAAAQQHAKREPGEHYLTLAIFPSDQLQVGGFDRFVTTSVPADEILQILADSFAVELVNETPKRPASRDEIIMFLNGDWYRLLDVAPPPDDVVEGLAVNTLHQRIIRTILGADDADVAQVAYVPAEGEPGDIENRCRESGEVGFAVYPPTVEEVMAVSESGGLMPPKSTFFVPKVRSGVFLVPR